MKNKQLFEAWDSISPSQADKDRMLRHIRQAEQPKSRFQARRVLALALVLVAVLGATAFALSEGGVINWFGKKVTDNMPNFPETDMDLETVQTRAQMAKELLAEAPEDELWIAEIWEKTQIVSTPSRSFPSPEALSAHLSSVGLIFPTRLPSGYQFKSGGITAYPSKNTVENGLLPLDDQQTEHGFIIRKYRLTTDYAADIDKWYAKFGDDKGNVLVLNVFRDSHSTQYSFNISAEGQHEVLTIPGMTEALYIRNKDSRYEHSLNFRQTGLPRIFSYHWYQPRQTPDVNLQANYYDSLVYQFESNALGKEALLEIANSME